MNSFSNFADKLTTKPESNILAIIKETQLTLGGLFCIYNKLDSKQSSLICRNSDMSENDDPITDPAPGHICYDATILGIDKVVVISDLKSTKFASSDPAVSKYKLRSYLGVPVRLGTTTIGSLAIVDTVVREFSDDQIEKISNFALLIMLEEQHILTQKGLIEANKKAEESNKMKSLSLASMSHELRTPLNSIIGFSDLLLDEDTTTAEKEMFSKLIQTAGRSLMQLIADIVDISKIEAGEVTIQKELFNVNSFLQEVLLMFKQIKENKDKANIELKLVLSDQTADLKIETDAYRLRQVFNNLLTNSLKFIDEGYVEFGYSSVIGENIQFYVKDTGVGIESDKKEKIFEHYGQDKSTYSRNREGTGLGLAISKSFVELLGGRIWVDSELNEGSTFYFTIPYNVSSAINDNYMVDSLKFGSINWTNHTILIVDDVKENFVFLKGLLNHTKAQLLWAKNGQEAVNICRENKSINIILMDIRMPVLNGFEASAIIKKENPNIRIIAQTAFSNPDDRKKCLDSGCDEYLKKPIDYKQLFSAISKYLG